jgi:hypothetical protein
VIGGGGWGQGKNGTTVLANNDASGREVGGKEWVGGVDLADMGNEVTMRFGTEGTGEWQCPRVNGGERSWVGVGGGG